MIRKLPLYLLISGSPVTGKESFEAILYGFQNLKKTFMQEPYILETLYVSVIQVSSDAWTINTLTPICHWRPPLLFPEGTGELAFGAAFKLLDFRISQEVILKSLEFEGDFCPLVFIMVSSPPTDDWVDVTSSVLKRTLPHIANCVTVLVGPNVKLSDFEKVLGLNPMNDSDGGSLNFKHFFRWVDQ